MKKVDFKKYLNYFNLHREEGLKTRALRDWKIIVFGFVFLFVFIVVIDGFIFLKYQKEFEKEPVVKEENSLKIDEGALQRALDKINIRNERFKNSIIPPEINDPAI